jgi:hypothetical protein
MIFWNDNILCNLATAVKHIEKPGHWGEAMWTRRESNGEAKLSTARRASRLS